MSENFGLKIGLEGEKEFKKSLAEINNSFKVLGSEMKLVDSQFDKNDKSTEALTARSEVLNKEIDSQKQKIETLRSALANAAESFGENDRRTQSWQIQLNNAQTALNGMEHELSSNNTALEKADNENEVMRYEEYFSEGAHTKTYTCPFTSEVGQNTMSLSMVSSDGTEGIFPKMQTWSHEMGAYLAGDTPWDGYIEAREDEVHFTMRRTVRKSLVRTSDTLLFEVFKSHKFPFVGQTH